MTGPGFAAGSARDVMWKRVSVLAPVSRVRSTMTMPFSPGQSWRLRKPAHVMDAGGFAGPDTPVTAVGASVLAEGGIFEIIGFLFIHAECDVRAQRALTGLQGEDVIGASVDQLVGDHLAGDLAAFSPWHRW